MLLAEAGIKGVELVGRRNARVARCHGHRAEPLGKIPRWKRADGPTLYDSRVICRYLDAFSGAGSIRLRRNCGIP